MKRENKRRITTLLTMVLLLVGSTLFAQKQNQISGTVKDSDGNPILGATVYVEGTNIGGITNAEGFFKLSAPIGGVLGVSYVGYQTSQTPITSQTFYLVELQDENTDLEEVVVVAYGVQKKETLTGAITSISTTDLLKSPNASIGNSLAGKLTGVSTVQSSGQPGMEDPDIYIRGGGSLSSSDSTPLILVDGVERSFFQMDPNEIESVTVLKDASATAVFGVRGANGVILVTTLRGKKGEPRISISSSVGLQKTTYNLEMADSYTFGTIHNEMNANDGTTQVFSDYMLERFLLGDEPIKYPDIDWRDYMTNDVAITTQQNVNISGGSDKVAYFVSLGYLFQDGLFKDFGDPDLGYDYNRYNYRSNLDIDVTSSLLMKIGIGGVVGDTHEPYYSSSTTDGLWKAINWAQPFASPGLVDGVLMQTPATMFPDITLRNPMAYYYGDGYKNMTSNKLNMDVSLTQDLECITKGLSAEVKAAYNSSYTYTIYRSGNVETYYPYYTSELDGSGLSYDDDDYDKTLVYLITGENERLGYSTSTSRSRDWYAEASIRYNRDFGKHSVGGLVLYNQSKEYYPSGDYVYIPSAYVGLVGRVTYDYDNKYMAEFNIGYNGSENFAADQRFGTFPAVSLGYTLSEEPFMKNQNVISYLKLRASVGLVGKDNVSSYRFLYLPNSYIIDSASKDSTWYQYDYGYNFGVDNSSWSYGAMENIIGNPDLTWETVLKQNYGIDMNFLDGRLKVVADYFKEERVDILIQRSTIPSLTGLTTDILPIVNMGQVDNTGFEVSLGWADQINKDWRYSVEANVSYAHNTIVFQDEVEPNETYMWRTGNPVGSIFGFVADGFYSESDFESDGSLKDTFADPYVSTVYAGDVIYKDLNNDGQINEDDQMKIGYSTIPEYTLGLNIGLNYKNWSFSMNWSGATNRSLLLSDEFREPFNSENRSLMMYHVDNRWTPETADTATQPRISKVSCTNNYLDSTLWIEDGSYIRLKNMSIGYTFRQSDTLKKFGIENLGLTFSGYNLLTFSYFDMMDPESNPSNSGDTYPIVKTFNFGINITI
ncbi:MAG: TonB-dependent receptor [Rikenellaceae bacterium]